MRGLVAMRSAARARDGRTILLLAALLLVAGFRSAAADTLDVVKRRGQLICGVATAGVGLSIPDSKGVWRGIDADYCRAFAAAILGDPARLRFVPTTTEQRFTALQSGEVDVLARATSWTFSRDTGQGLVFIGVNLYDGQGFMVKRAAGVTRARGLDGATICLRPGSTAEQNVQDYFTARHMTLTPVIIEQASELNEAFFSGRCDALSSDKSDLVGIRAAQGPRAADYVILPETISKEPLGPLVRQGDPRWFSIIKWIHFALIAAEEQGITQANVAQMRASPVPEIRRLLGASGGLGRTLGLDDQWAAHAIAAVGNYGEIWARNEGVLGADRGLNRLWSDGGLMYSPPFR